MVMSLYEDQEKAVVRRGELEEQLMSGAPTEPLQVIGDHHLPGSLAVDRPTTD